MRRIDSSPSSPRLTTASGLFEGGKTVSTIAETCLITENLCQYARHAPATTATPATHRTHLDLFIVSAIELTEDSSVDDVKSFPRGRNGPVGFAHPPRSSKWTRSRPRGQVGGTGEGDTSQRFALRQFRFASATSSSPLGGPPKVGRVGRKAKSEPERARPSGGGRRRFLAGPVGFAHPPRSSYRTRSRPRGQVGCTGEGGTSQRLALRQFRFASATSSFQCSFVSRPPGGPAPKAGRVGRKAKERARMGETIEGAGGVGAKIGPAGFAHPPRSSKWTRSHPRGQPRRCAEETDRTRRNLYY